MSKELPPWNGTASSDALAVLSRSWLRKSEKPWLGCWSGELADLSLTARIPESAAHGPARLEKDSTFFESKLRAGA
jgi:hypothetical protein